MRNPRYTQLLAKMAALHDAKNHDYAEDGSPFSNFEFAAQFAGVTVDQVFDVMIGIKQARLAVLQKKEAPNFESLHDTRVDQANYAALKAAYHEPLILGEMVNTSGRVVCGHAAPSGRWSCSLAPQHISAHRAYSNHDVAAGALQETW